MKLWTAGVNTPCEVKIHRLEGDTQPSLSALACRCRAARGSLVPASPSWRATLETERKVQRLDGGRSGWHPA